MSTKPLKLDLVDGKIKQFNQQDQLPNQEQLDTDRLLIRKLLFELHTQGFRFNDLDLINELNLYNP